MRPSLPQESPQGVKPSRFQRFLERLMWRQLTKMDLLKPRRTAMRLWIANRLFRLRYGKTPLEMAAERRMSDLPKPPPQLNPSPGESVDPVAVQEPTNDHLGRAFDKVSGKYWRVMQDRITGGMVAVLGASTGGFLTYNHERLSLDPWEPPEGFKLN